MTLLVATADEPQDAAEEAEAGSSRWLRGKVAAALFKPPQERVLQAAEVLPGGVYV